MHFNDMIYHRITYEEIQSGYQELWKEVKRISHEEDCEKVLKKHYQLLEQMTPMDLCYVRHDMDLNDPFYSGEQDYYDRIGLQISELSNQY